MLACVITLSMSAAWCRKGMHHEAMTCLLFLAIQISFYRIHQLWMVAWLPVLPNVIASISDIAERFTKYMC